MPFYMRNGRSVTKDEAADETGCIRQGYAIHHSIMHMDSTPLPLGSSRIFVNDSDTSVTINDAMSQLSTELRSKIMHTQRYLSDDRVATVDNGIQQMQGIIGRMEMQRAGYGGGRTIGAGPGMVTDADKSALNHVIEYCRGMIAGAQARKSRLGR